MTGGRHTRSVHPLIVALRAERERQNLTQRSIARRSGWAVRTVAALERGENHPTANFLEDYASVLGLTVRLVRADGTVLPRGEGLPRALCTRCGRTYQVYATGRIRTHACDRKAAKP